MTYKGQDWNLRLPVKTWPCWFMPAGPLYGPFLPDGSGRIVSRAYDFGRRNRNVQEAFCHGIPGNQKYNINAQAYIDIKLFKD
jgi:hypothetical protein